MNDFAYTVVRSARRSFSVSVGVDGTVTVRCPRYASRRDIDEFIREKKEWIRRKLDAVYADNAELGEVTAYRKILVCGEPTDLRLGERDCVGEGYICAENIGHIKNIYVRAFGGAFREMFVKLCDRYGFAPSGFKFRDFISRWGECSADGVITFNYKLLMLPYDMQLYVCVHELCHLRYLNHSAAFYAEVEGIMPEYREVRARIKKYSRIARLYR